MFFRNTSSDSVGVLLQNMDECRPLSMLVEGVSVKCGPGTHSSQTVVKEYHLYVDKGASIDAADWSCALDANKQTSPHLHVQLNCKL